MDVDSTYWEWIALTVVRRVQESTEQKNDVIGAKLSHAFGKLHAEGQRINHR